MVGCPSRLNPGTQLEPVDVEGQCCPACPTETDTTTPETAQVRELVLANCGQFGSPWLQLHKGPGRRSASELRPFLQMRGCNQAICNMYSLLHVQADCDTGDISCMLWCDPATVSHTAKADDFCPSRISVGAAISHHGSC